MQKIETLKPNDKDVQDDLFICIGSPEERCKGSILKFDQRYKPKSIILLRYSDSFNKKRENNISFIRNFASSISSYEEIIIDEEKPVPIIQNLINKIIQASKNSDHISITIDFSTMIKWHLLILLKGLALSKLIRNVRFIYTEPEDYITELFQPLSFGLKHIFPIPTFYGHYDFSKETLLVLFLGYEGDRAISIFEKVDPSDCLLLIGRPSYHIEWEGRTEEMNKDLIKLVGSDKIKYIDSRDPSIILQQLQSILNTPTFLSSNKLIAPLGTKPQTLGLFYYLCTNNVLNNVIYSSPLRHNHLFYSSGIGPTWEIPNIL